MAEAFENLRIKVLDIMIHHLNNHEGDIDGCKDAVCQLAKLADNAIFEIDSEGEHRSFHIVGEQLRNIPMGELRANRYDTDTLHVIHLWRDEASYDVNVPRQEFLR